MLSSRQWHDAEARGVRLGVGSPRGGRHASNRHADVQKECFRRHRCAKSDSQKDCRKCDSAGWRCTRRHSPADSAEVENPRDGSEPAERAALQEAKTRYRRESEVLPAALECRANSSAKSLAAADQTLMRSLRTKKLPLDSEKSMVSENTYVKIRNPTLTFINRFYRSVNKKLVRPHFFRSFGIIGQPLVRHRSGAQ